ncbi:MAG: hypothetical protein HQ517_08580 [SAR324 cluster bacterium]|nr:hypothetical protein [SAR324 cluster bacterium]
MPDYQSEEVLLVEKRCKLCDLIFNICRCCDKGRIYCSDQCREISRIIAHRRVQSNYRISPLGRKTNRLSAQKRRIKSNQKSIQAGKNESDQKSVADRGTIWSRICDMVLSSFSDKELRCHFCGTKGIVVKQFPHRGYSKGALLKSSI